ncbi:S-layer homology domain-containing protein [uncultured Oscillibacter sp.]|uniref:S-layer homology domain-containing protein n=1 Tax=uncultured Oscillibacter sp. TaxID=876091 RepID=UPI00272CE34D|nr:S-layer homology domain-containing protein [uncultured Oscillibacter sp.]
MKKFLSLVLALIMTMSLVTISAGATEYKDLTDKDEIQYEEAVAVLNRIGVITGYEDGSFRPETELTRGAAAKIIVSLMIGPDAASALPNNASPYPDVPAGHTFAGVIGYCKTAGYISGYGDGTFKPANPLTGYAFAKMLLGAVGYKSNIEGFVDTGWTMNVARIGNVAGLFDRISFDGAKAVTRDEACQLALNTLKATMVDYGNANTVVSSSGEVLTVQGSKAVYRTSNNRDINANINRRVINATNNEMTLEFGEEHFKDLRLEHDRYDPAYDVYGHPSNEWSYKKVTIGTFPLKADFTFTKQISHIEDTAATKEKALGLRGYDTYSTDHKGGYVNWSTAASDAYGSSPFADATQIHINGWNARVYNDDYKQGNVPASVVKDGDGTVFTYDASKIDASNKEEAPSLSEIADLTDNGVTVEVYVCPVDADFITDVVVTRTQLMEVDRVASDYVDLDTVSPDSKDETLTEIAGYNDFALHYEVSSVKDNSYDAYNVLKELKSGDEVAIIPYTTDDGKTWEVGEAYVPETVSGALTNVDIYNTKSKADGNAIAITVGGTTYPIAQWNKDMRKITGYMIKASKKDVTLLLDKTGNALLAKDVGSTDAWIVVGDYYQAAGASGRVGWFVHGWTIKGDEVDLDLGTIRGAAEKYAPGELVQYRVAEEGNGEYELNKPNFEQRSALKNGNLGWTEPKLQDGYLKDGKTPKYTGEGIYNVAQYAAQNGSTDSNKYNIKSVNTLVPLEFYNTTLNIQEGDKYKGTQTGVHYDYSKADANNEVGKDACVALTGASGTSSRPNYSGVSGADDGFDTWTYRTAPYDGVKFIYVGFDPANGEVDTISFMDGVQNVPYDELKQINRWWRNVGTNDDSFVASPAEAYVDKNGKVKAVVIKSDSAEASLKDLIVITDNKGANTSTKGGAEAPTSGTYYTRQYVSGEDGFKEEKTGYFDRMLSVGTVVTGRLESNGIFKTRTFHSNEYTNRNPDGIYVKGIAPLKTLNDKNSNTEFYIGAKAEGVVQTLGTGVKGGDTVLTNGDSCYILSGVDVMGVHDPEEVKGLVKVNGSTQFIDLRDGRPGDIADLEDLLERENSQIELKLILNGNKNSDGFRTAYAVLILAAGPAADNAKTPDVTITGKTERVTWSGTFNKTEVKTGTGTEKDPYVYEITPDTEIELTANVSVTGVAESAKWTNLSEKLTLANNNGPVTVLAPASKDDDAVKLMFQVTNRDNSVKDEIRTEEKVYVNIVAKDTTGGQEPDGTKYTLTLVGDSTFINATSGAAQVDVFAGSAGVAGTAGTQLINGAAKKVQTYEVTGGADVTVLVKAAATDLVTASKTVTVDGLAIAAKNDTTNGDSLSFTMPNSNLTLNMSAPDTFVSDKAPTVTYSVTLHEGITGTYKESATATESKPLNAASDKGAGVTQVPNGAVITITGLEGAVAIARGTPLAVAGATTYAKGDTLTISAASVELWAATEVELDAKTKVASPAISASGDVYVPIGTELTPEKAAAGDSYTAFIAVTGANTKASTTEGAFTVSGKDKIFVYAAYELTLAEGLKITIDGKDFTGTVYVDQDTQVTPVSSTDLIAVEKTAAGQVYGTEFTAAKLTADTELLAMTKVTLTGNKITKATWFSSESGDKKDIATVSNKDVVIGVLANEKITAVGKTTTAGTKISVTAAGSAPTITEEMAADNTSAATATFVVGTEAITVTET